LRTPESFLRSRDIRERDTQRPLHRVLLVHEIPKRAFKRTSELLLLSTPRLQRVVGVLANRWS
jgi:hypothetical protein